MENKEKQELKNTLINYIEKYDDKEDVKSYKFLIDELIFNIEEMRKAKESIRRDGHVINVTQDPNKAPYYQMNRSLNAYNQFFSNAKDIITKIGLSPKDKKALNLYVQEAETPDELQKILG